MDIQFRLGTVDDAAMIVGLINELAEYEKLPDTITTTEEDIRTAIANRDIETLFASSDGKPVVSQTECYPEERLDILPSVRRNSGRARQRIIMEDVV